MASAVKCAILYSDYRFKESPRRGAWRFSSFRRKVDAEIFSSTGNKYHCVGQCDLPLLVQQSFAAFWAHRGVFRAAGQFRHVRAAAVELRHVEGRAAGLASNTRTVSRTLTWLSRPAVDRAELNAQRKLAKDLAKATAAVLYDLATGRRGAL